MPWKRHKKVVYKLENGKWKVHAHAETITKAKNLIRYLRQNFEEK
jgi:imidazolonepropionase-like amidohydrolase